MHTTPRRPRQLGLATITAALLVAALLSLAPQRAAAQEGQRCFPETGFCVSGPIRSYWERNGGLAVFGFPISPERRETVEASWTGPVQWFERDRLEDHSNEGLGVLAGRLGARALELQGVNWQALPGDDAATPGCRFFRETQLNLCEPFLSYWEGNGGLERFGYPLTRPRSEQIEGREYEVQYFERRRMELHPENQGTPYAILLGLLGRDIYAVEGDSAVVAVPPGDVASETQQAILDASYATLRARGTQGKLAVGLIEIAGEYAAARAQPFGQRTIYVYLALRDGQWQVVEATSIPSSEILRQRGIPEELWSGGDADAVVDLALAQLQSLAGQGLNAFVTRPRIAGDYARLWLVPGATANLDMASAFFRRDGAEWQYLGAGSAYPEEDLRAMGIPEELWPYGEAVRGPAE
jgi:hypothetical protein